MIQHDKVIKHIYLEVIKQILHRSYQTQPTNGLKLIKNKIFFHKDFSNKKSFISIVIIEKLISSTKYKLYINLDTL